MDNTVWVRKMASYTQKHLHQLLNSIHWQHKVFLLDEIFQKMALLANKSPPRIKFGEVVFVIHRTQISSELELNKNTAFTNTGSLAGCLLLSMAH